MPSAPDPNRAPLSRSDQRVLALCMVALMIGLLTWLGWTQFRTGLADLDQLPSEEVPFRIDVQTATWQEFAQLPGVGEKLSKRIVQSRKTDGPFVSPDDLERVRGIGPTLRSQMQPYLRFGSAPYPTQRVQ